MRRCSKRASRFLTRSILASAISATLLAGRRFWRRDRRREGRRASSRKLQLLIEFGGRGADGPPATLSPTFCSKSARAGASTSRAQRRWLLRTQGIPTRYVRGFNVIGSQKKGRVTMSSGSGIATLGSKPLSRGRGGSNTTRRRRRNTRRSMLRSMNGFVSEVSEWLRAFFASLYASLRHFDGSRWVKPGMWLLVLADRRVGGGAKGEVSASWESGVVARERGASRARAIAARARRDRREARVAAPKKSSASRALDESSTGEHAGLRSRSWRTCHRRLLPRPFRWCEPRELRNFGTAPISHPGGEIQGVTCKSSTRRIPNLNTRVESPHLISPAQKYILWYILWGSQMAIKISKIFRSGNSQAVRIPKDFQLEGTEVGDTAAGRIL